METGRNTAIETDPFSTLGSPGPSTGEQSRKQDARECDSLRGERSHRQNFACGTVSSDMVIAFAEVACVEGSRIRIGGPSLAGR